MFDLARRIVAVILIVSTVLIFTGCGDVSIPPPVVDPLSGPYCRVGYRVVWDPPGSDLANFDTTQGLLTLTLTNGTISSTSGTATLAVIDHANGQIVGQQTFGYVVVGNSLYAQDSAAVHNWLLQFAGYADVDVQVDVTPVITALSDGEVSATGSAVYQGTTYASATAAWTYSGAPGGGGPCHTRICPNQ